MTVSDIRSVSTRLRLLFCLIIMLVITGQPVNTSAADGARENFKHILKSTMEGLWTGREFTPKLVSRQKTLINMLETGEVKKPELGKMMGKTILAMLNRHQTSRYILKAMPERFNALFSPHINWEEMRTILWQSLSSFIKKDDPFFIKVGTMAPRPGVP